jgi:hypothetical protein
MANFIWKIVETLLMIDDKDLDSTLGMRRWRGLVALFVLLFAVHIAWACGILSSLGLEGFAQARDIKAVSNQLTSAKDAVAQIQAQILEKSIIDIRIQQCLSQSKRYYTDRLRELSDQYYATNQHQFVLPTCAELN